MFLIIKIAAKVLLPLQNQHKISTKTTETKRPTKTITVQNPMKKHRPKHEKIVVSLQIAPKITLQKPSKKEPRQSTHRQPDPNIVVSVQTFEIKIEFHMKCAQK